MDFSSASQVFYRSSQIVFFQQRSRPQVNNMGKVLRNNFDYPKICLFFEGVKRGSE